MDIHAIRYVRIVGTTGTFGRLSVSEHDYIWQVEEKRCILEEKYNDLYARWKDLDDAAVTQEIVIVYCVPARLALKAFFV